MYDNYFYNICMNITFIYMYDNVPMSDDCRISFLHTENLRLLKYHQNYFLFHLSSITSCNRTIEVNLFLMSLKCVTSDYNLVSIVLNKF